MPTYTINGIAVLHNNINNDTSTQGILPSITLSITVPSTTATLSYTNSVNPDPDEAHPISDIQIPDAQVLLDGEPLDSDEDSIFRVTWNDNGVTRSAVVLQLFHENAQVPGYSNIDATALFLLDGDTPSFSTIAEWNAFEASVTSVSPLTGAFGPGQTIPLSSLGFETAQGVFLTGTDGDDLLEGGDGNDTLFGGEGSDTLIGGDGDDILNPGDNNWDDYVRPGTGNDQVVMSDIEIGWTGIDHSDLAHGIVATINGTNNTGNIVKGGGGGTTQLIDVVNPLTSINGFGFYGSHHDDTITITLGENQWMQVRGRAGDDQIVINGDDGYVRLDHRTAQSGISANLLSGIISNDGDGGRDTITGSGDVRELRGSMHDDSIRGSGRDESFILMAGNDTLNAAFGFDRLRYDRSGVDAVEVNLTQGTATGTWSGETFNHQISGIEWVRGSREGDDSLLGNRAANRLEGIGGNDTLNGYGGDDTLDGGTGNDRVYGGYGNDEMRGSSGHDRLYGNHGNDTMAGDFGNDRLYGHVGNDLMSGGSGNDRLFGGSGNDTMTGGNGHDRLYGGTGRDDMAGGSGNDRLYGGAGSDDMTGGRGNDTLIGGSGHDTLDGGSGDDYLRGNLGVDTFVFSTGQDRVAFFASNDIIDLGNASGITNYGDLIDSHVSEIDGNLMITDDAGNSMTLLGRDIDDISADDFLF